MTTQNYLIIENNVVNNIVVWDGNTADWTPPADSIQLIQDTTPTMVWKLSSDKTNYVLTEQLGGGAIGFTWNGSVLTTNEPQPAPIKQPTTSGTATA